MYPKMALPPILSVALPSDTGRVLSIQSHTVQVQPAALPDPVLSSICYLGSCLLPPMIEDPGLSGSARAYGFAHSHMDVALRSCASHGVHELCFRFGGEAVVVYALPCGLG